MDSITMHMDCSEDRAVLQNFDFCIQTSNWSYELQIQGTLNYFHWFCQIFAMEWLFDKKGNFSFHNIFFTLSPFGSWCHLCNLDAAYLSVLRSSIGIHLLLYKPFHYQLYYLEKSKNQFRLNCSYQLYAETVLFFFRLSPPIRNLTKNS